VSQRTAIKFLRSTWGQQHGTGVAFLSTKDWDTEAWEDLPQQGKVTLPTLDDLYFCPNFFLEPRRLRKVVQPGRWLYADLDEVDPGKLPDFLEPTVAWETSPGRFQALWLLARPLRPAQLEAINQKLTYYTMADRGGWSSTKVLRVPGSYNNKRERRHLVRLLWSDGPEYAASTVYDLVREVETPRDVAENLPDLKLPKADAARLFKRHRPKLTIEARRLLKEPVAQGGRSEAMWKLQRLLLEAGIAPAQAFVMVKAAPCNKYRGQRREDKQLWTEIQRATAQSGKKVAASGRSGAGSGAVSVAKAPGAAASKSSTSTTSGSTSHKTTSRIRERREQTNDGASRFVSYDDFIEDHLPKPDWLVEGIWSEDAHGVIAGEPKTYKSVLSTDLAVSVASGTPFLGHFPVNKSGPVILIQKENNAGEVQDRLQRIAKSKKLAATAGLNHRRLLLKRWAHLPITLMNNADWVMTNEDDLEELQDEIVRLKPVLLVLDPFYHLSGGVEENSAKEVNEALTPLMELSQRYKMATVVIHHYNKGNADRPTRGGSRISGSGVFHRWYESAVFLERDDVTEHKVRLYPEHRNHGPQAGFEVDIDLGTRHDLRYAVEVTNTRAQAANEHQTIREVVEAAGGNLSLSDLMGLLDMKNRDAAKRKVENTVGVSLALGRSGGKRAYIVKASQNGQGLN